ncbi:MAG: GlsB/YeaQ/YmgE family stress response membrane protein [Longimicrobiales bacterium]
MDIIWMIIVGLIVGAVAKLIMPGRDPGGIIVTILLGILGSIVGGFVLGIVLPGRSGAGPMGLVASVAGALFLLWVYRSLVAQRAPRI